MMVLHAPTVKKTLKLIKLAAHTNSLIIVNAACQSDGHNDSQWLITNIYVVTICFDKIENSCRIRPAKTSFLHNRVTLERSLKNVLNYQFQLPNNCNNE